MRRLEEIRLVNWHSFGDEIIRVEGDVLLTGENGTGKSTILDAVQYALVADLSLVRFNQAANETGRRDLVGYVRGKEKLRDARRPDEVRFRRNASTSHVSLRFADDADPAQSFVCGIVMEVSEGDPAPVRHHYIWPRGHVSQVPAVTPDGHTIPSREFRNAVRELGAAVYPDVTEYQEEVRHRLGFLPESFHRLLVKALAFKPLGEVRQFVTDYLLEERPLETSALQWNVQHYHQLEAEAADGERRIAALKEIEAKHEDVNQSRAALDNLRYVSFRAEVEVRLDEFRTVEAEISSHEDSVETAKRDAGILKQRVELLTEQRDRVVGVLHGNPTFVERERTRDELKTAKAALAHAEEAAGQVQHISTGMLRTLNRLSSADAQAWRSTEAELLGGDPFADPERVLRSREFLARAVDPDGRRLNAWRKFLSDGEEVFARAGLRLESRVLQQRGEAEQLSSELRDLEAGRPRYTEQVDALLHLLETRLQGRRDARPLCELIEVADPLWTDAVEGYLGAAKFSVVLDPQDYPAAVRHYEKYRHGYRLPGRGEVKIYGVRVIDLDGVRRDGRSRRQGSLAEKVGTDDPLARLFVDWLLGDVMCVTKASELSEHRQAVTPGAMAHKGHGTFQIPARDYRDHHIGQAAREARRQKVSQELARLTQLIRDAAPLDQFLRDARTDCVTHLASLERLTELAQRAATQSGIEERVLALKARIASLEGDDALATQEKLRDSLNEAIQTTNQSYLERFGQAKELEGALKELYKKHQGAENALASSSRRLREEFPEDTERTLENERKYQKERLHRSAAEIRQSYERQGTGYETRVRNHMVELKNRRDRFDAEFSFSAGDMTDDDISPYIREKDVWESSRIVEYREKMAAAREKARHQLAEDYVYQIYDSILTMEERFDELNTGLAKVRFGWGRYRFSFAVRRDHQEMVALIRRVGQYGKDTLFGAADLLRDETREAFDALADRILRLPAKQVTSELEALSDYREFFNYDLILETEKGYQASHGDIAETGSGGETQTPYYIAVFAAMHQMYAQGGGRRRRGPGGGLVLLDEAFSKMDEPRIAAVLEAAREMKLQLLMVTPGDKVRLIVPHVTTTVVVNRDQVDPLAVPYAAVFNKRLNPDAYAEVESLAEDLLQAT